MTAPVATAPFRPRKDMQVTVNHPRYAGQVWVIEKVNPVNCALRPLNNPTGRGLNAPKEMLAEHTGGTPALPTMLRPFVPEPRTGLGTVVRIKKSYNQYTTTDLFTVISVNDRTLSLALLGGREGDRYLRVGKHGVTEVNLADILR
jgi:hypothetical protein